MSLVKTRILLITSIVSLFCGISGFIMHFLLRQNIINIFGKSAYNIAGIVASTLDVNKIIHYRDSLQMDDEYVNIVKKLDLIKQRSGLFYLYVDSWSDDGSRFDVYDATEPGDGVENSAYGRCLLGNRVEKNENFVKLVVGDEDLKSWHEDHNEYGNTICAYYPIKDSNGKNVALVGADFEIQEVLNILRNLFWVSFLFINVLIILLNVVVIKLIDFYVSLPLKNIIETIRHFVSSDHSKITASPIKLKTKLPDNSAIKLLVNSINKMMLDVKRHFEYVKKIVTEKEQISTELNIATRIQKSLIPHTFPAFPELEEIDIYATMDLAQKVGGDFYDFFLMSKDKLAFIIADVSGKGIAAALFMVIAKTLIKNQAAVYNDPRIIIENVNKQMCMDNSSGMFITAFFGILDLKTGEIQYVNAGHMNPIAKLGDNNFRELELDKQFIVGGMPSVKFKSSTMKLSAGDTLFMYTDGVSESKNENNSYFGKDNLISALDSLDPSVNLKQIPDFVKSKIKKFTNNANQCDDITMLIIKYNGTIR